MVCLICRRYVYEPNGVRAAGGKSNMSDMLVMANNLSDNYLKKIKPNRKSSPCSVFLSLLSFCFHGVDVLLLLLLLWLTLFVCFDRQVAHSFLLSISKGKDNLCCVQVVRYTGRHLRNGLIAKPTNSHWVDSGT